MAIKSAYELAMERASNIKVDKVELKRKEYVQKGKEIASAYLNQPKFDIEKLKPSSEIEDKESYLKGIIWVFTKNIKLPNTTLDVDKLLQIKEGFLIISNKVEDIENIFTKLISAYQQYIDNSKTLLEQAKTEFAPRLQQKAMMLAQQTGQMVPIEPETDRDFIEFHRGQQVQVDDHYKAFLTQVTNEFENLI